MAIDYQKLLRLYVPVALILITICMALLAARVARFQLYPSLYNSNDTEDPSAVGYDWTFHYCYANNLFDASKCGSDFYAPLSHILADAFGFGNVKSGFIFLIVLVIAIIGLVLTFNSKIAFIIYFSLFFFTPVFLGLEYKLSTLIAYINTGFVPTLLILAMLAFQLYYWNKLNKFAKIAFIIIGLLIHHYIWLILLFTAILFQLRFTRRTIVETLLVLSIFISVYSVSVQYMTPNWRWIGYIFVNGRMPVFSSLLASILAGELIQDTINRHNSK